MKAIKYAPGKYASPLSGQPAASTQETSTSSSSASKNSLILYNKLETLTPFQPTTQLVPLSAKCILTSQLLPMTIIPHHCYQHWPSDHCKGSSHIKVYRTTKEVCQYLMYISTYLLSYSWYSLLHIELWRYIKPSTSCTTSNNKSEVLTHMLTLAQLTNMSTSNFPWLPPSKWWWDFVSPLSPGEKTR